MDFRFTFDPNGTPVVLTDEPRGWREAEIVIKRDQELRGQFINYITELEFWGDGYTHLNDLIASSGFCTREDILIERKCTETDPFTTFFEGVIELALVKNDTYNCIIFATIEDNSLSALILRLSDVPVPIDQGFTLEGSVLADIGIGTRFISTNNSGSIIVGPRTTYRVGDLFEYILNYITDNAVTFVSDLYRVDTNQIEIHAFIFAGLFVPGNVVAITYKNFYGTTISRGIPFAGSHAATLLAITTALSFQSAGVVSSIDFRNWDTASFSEVNDDGLTTVTAESWLPFTDLTCGVIGGASQPVCTILKTQTLTDGMRHLSATSGSLLVQSDDAKLRISLRRLFIECNKLNNISFRLQDVAGTPTFELDRTEDLFVNSSTFTINNVRDLIYEFTDEFMHPALKVGNEEELSIKQWSDDDWSIGDCAGEFLDLDNVADLDTGQLMNTVSGSNTERIESEDLYFIEVTDDTAVLSERYFLQKFRTDVPGFAFQSVGNVFLIDAHKLRYWFFNIRGNMTGVNKNSVESTVKTVTNSNTLNLEKIYKFTFPLNKTDFDTIVANATKFITFNPGTAVADDINGWIKELRMKVLSGRTEFQLYTE